MTMMIVIFLNFKKKSIEDKIGLGVVFTFIYIFNGFSKSIKKMVTRYQIRLLNQCL
jgi:hypothetical protein